MFPRLIDIGPVSIATYGALVAVAYLIGILWLKTERERMGLSEDLFWGLIYALFFGALAGGKLLFMALNWEAYASGEMGLITDFRYGFVFFGGAIGMFLTGWLYARRFKLDYLRIADYFGVAGPMGHWLGRLGCLAAGCCYGLPASVPWAVRFTDPASLVGPELLGTPLHPVQAYESLGVLAIAAGLLPVLRRVQARRLRPGTVIFGFFLLYSLLRFGVEFFRGDDRGGPWLGLSPSQWIALGCAAASGAALLRRGARLSRR